MTPLSQFVGSQAAINVIVGERYKQVTDQTIEYAMGIWGKEGAALMDQDVKEKILNRPRAKEIAARPHPSDTLARVAGQIRRQGIPTKKCCLRFFTSKEDVERMHAAGPPRTYASQRQPARQSRRRAAKQKDRNSVFIQRPGFTLRMERRSAV